jgi:hypothetical protein
LEHIGLRLQGLDASSQTLALLEIASDRAAERRATPASVDELFEALALPRPDRIGNRLAALERRGFASRARGRGAVWRVTPAGRQELRTMFNDIELAALAAETDEPNAPLFAHSRHSLLSATFAPPDLLGPIGEFIQNHPFDLNVFAMTRFPTEEVSDPVASALDAASEVCGSHGHELLLASDRSIVDDLWANVAAHMWASRYGIAFFENRARRGININLSIEVGSMMMTGRRVALLKDSSVKKLPTDLVGKIYRALDITRPASVRRQLHAWFSKDLGLPDCPECP